MGVGDITISGVQALILTTCADPTSKWWHEADRSIWNLRNIKHAIFSFEDGQYLNTNIKKLPSTLHIKTATSTQNPSLVVLEHFKSGE